MSTHILHQVWMWGQTIKRKRKRWHWENISGFSHHSLRTLQCVCVCVLKTIQWYKEVYLCEFPLVWKCVCMCEWHPKGRKYSYSEKEKKNAGRDKETNCDISWFWQAPCQGEIASDARPWHDSASPHDALYMKLVLFSISSLFKCGAGAAERGGCRAWRVGWNWTASPHYCKHHPTRQARGSQGRRMRGALPGRDLLKHIH